MVLKGPALAEWYGPDSDRTYVDGDLWVSPSQVSLAEEVLAQLDFVPALEEGDLPAWWLHHASAWTRRRDGATIDLHRRLQTVHRDAEEVWSFLLPQCEEFLIGGKTALRLPEAARILHITLHACHHGGADPRGLRHLRAAIESRGAADNLWLAAWGLAQEIDAASAFSAGLRLTPQGKELAQRLQIPSMVGAESSLLAMGPVPVAMGFYQLSQASGMGRLEVLLRKCFPPAGFIRNWWRPAQRSYGWLIVGYIYRLVWLVRHCPSGYRRWRKVQKATRRSSLRMPLGN